MGINIDVPGRIGPLLREILVHVANDPEMEQPVTLGSVMQAMHEGLVDELEAEGRLDLENREALYGELEAAMEEFGSDALATNFIQAPVSDNLGRVIEEAMQVLRVPTLGAVRKAMLSGLTSTLVGRGMIDPDEDDSLLAEIDELIAIHGENALAEEFLGQEPDREI
ncbi:MAG: hypothetical protein AB1332_03610 [Pseudomonadota bacterium]|jgi:hypothetical protein